MNNQDIKALTPTVCPNCGKDIIVELTSVAPQLAGIYTPKDIEDAKNEALKQIAELDIPEEFTKPVTDWINNPDTIFVPADINEIIKNLKEQNESEEKN